MTVLFYTTAITCALRTAAWLSSHPLLPALSRIVSYAHSRYDSHAEGFVRHISPLAGDVPVTGTVFKFMCTIAGHKVFVPVSKSIAEQSLQQHLRASWHQKMSRFFLLLLPLLQRLVLFVFFSVSLRSVLVSYCPALQMQATDTSNIRLVFITVNETILQGPQRPKTTRVCTTRAADARPELVRPHPLQVDCQARPRTRGQYSTHGGALQCSAVSILAQAWCSFRRSLSASLLTVSIPAPLLITITAPTQAPKPPPPPHFPLCSLLPSQSPTARYLSLDVFFYISRGLDMNRPIVGA